MTTTSRLRQDLASLQRGGVVEDNDDVQSGAPLKTGDVPSCSFITDDGSGMALEDIVASLMEHLKSRGY